MNFGRNLFNPTCTGGGGGGGLLGPRLTIFTDKKDALVGFF